MCHVVYIFPPVARPHMSCVDFKKWMCRHVEFRGHEVRKTPVSYGWGYWVPDAVRAYIYTNYMLI